MRHHQGLAEALVEALGDVAHELDVLALVVADRDLLRAVREHVRRLEHRVQEQARGHELALLRRLLLELCHPIEVSVRGDG